jgi:hypothetical protein
MLARITKKTQTKKKKKRKEKKKKREKYTSMALFKNGDMSPSSLEHVSRDSSFIPLHSLVKRPHPLQLEVETTSPCRGFHRKNLGRNSSFRSRQNAS